MWPAPVLAESKYWHPYNSKLSRGKMREKLQKHDSGCHCRLLINLHLPSWRLVSSTVSKFPRSSCWDSYISRFLFSIWRLLLSHRHVNKLQPVFSQSHPINRPPTCYTMNTSQCSTVSTSSVPLSAQRATRTPPLPISPPTEKAQMAPSNCPPPSQTSPSPRRQRPPGKLVALQPTPSSRQSEGSPLSNWRRAVLNTSWSRAKNPDRNMRCTNKMAIHGNWYAPYPSSPRLPHLSDCAVMKSSESDCLCFASGSSLWLRGVVQGLLNREAPEVVYSEWRLHPFGKSPRPLMLCLQPELIAYVSRDTRYVLTLDLGFAFSLIAFIALFWY